jgi:hypothetical protein
MATATANQRLTPELKAYIAEAIQDALADPDRGLELTEETKRRLRVAQRGKQKTVSLEKIREKYGI